MMQAMAKEQEEFLKTLGQTAYAEKKYRDLDRDRRMDDDDAGDGAQTGGMVGVGIRSSRMRGDP